MSHGSLTTPTTTSGPGAELNLNSFRCIAANGYGDPYNALAHGMALYKDRLYVGTSRANLCLLRRRIPEQAFACYPVKCPEDPFTLDLRAHIWRYDFGSSCWEKVHVAPTVTGKDDQPAPRDISHRGLAVFQGRSDSEPALYAVSYSPSRALTGPQILRSLDGEHFEPTARSGLETYEGLQSFRFLVPFKGRLFTSPIGNPGFIGNVTSYPLVLETDDPVSGRWREASLPGFGDPHNTAVFHMAAFRGRLYASTVNPKYGLQIWKTDAEGDPPYEWTRVITEGAYRGKLNQGGVVLCPFEDALYVGTAIQGGGLDRDHGVGPAAAEIIRIHPDDSWDLVVGDARFTRAGFKFPVSGLKPGFGGFFNGYVWHMAVHEGWLYAGTYDWSVFLSFTQIENWPLAAREMAERVGIEAIVEREAGCELWKTRDGKDWSPVTRNGFGNRFNCGIRNIVSTPHGLAIGTANFFGPEVAVKRTTWEYEHNPRGGMEIWLGTRDFGQDGEPDVERRKPVVSTAPPALAAFAASEVSSSKLPTLSYQELYELDEKIDVPSVLPERVVFTEDYHSPLLEGIEHVPTFGPAIVVSNHPATALFVDSTVVTEDVLLTANVLFRYLGRPARILASEQYYAAADGFRASQSVIEKLGFVPATVDNGIRLLEQGATVLVYPEGQGSIPPYRTRPFSADFARMALATGAPIIPLALLGPHESRLRVEHRGATVILNKHVPLKVKYLFKFLQPIAAHEIVRDLHDEQALMAFCELVREKIQAALDTNCRGREFFKLAAALQKTYGLVSTQMSPSVGPASVSASDIVESGTAETH